MTAATRADLVTVGTSLLCGAWGSYTFALRVGKSRMTMTLDARESDLLWQHERPYFGMGKNPNLKTISDDDLLRRLSDLVGQSRCVEADLVAHIAEVDERRLYAREATPSMFVYCTEVLHLSEAEAWLRINAARSSREHPMLLTMLRDGRLHLSGIRRLAPHLTRENRELLLKRATHKSRRQIEELVAELTPRPDVPAVMRKLPKRRANAQFPAHRELGPDPVERSTLISGPARIAPPNPEAPRGGASAGEGLGPDPVAEKPTWARAATVEPLAAARYKVQFTASVELRDKLERLQALMRSSVPDGDLARIIDLAVTEKLERLEARRFAKTKASRKSLAETDTRPKSRYIPAPVRRTVEKRDGGRCTYRDGHGRRCNKHHDVEFHHRRPFGRGGEHSPEVLRLMCKAHNALLAERDYGKEVMARYRRGVRQVPEAAAGH